MKIKVLFPENQTTTFEQLPVNSFFTDEKGERLYYKTDIGGDSNGNRYAVLITDTHIFEPSTYKFESYEDVVPVNVEIYVKPVTEYEDRKL